MHEQELESELHSIKVSEILKVYRLNNPMSESYFADLTNGDTITADQFHSGPLAGQIRCMRRNLCANPYFESDEVRLPKNIFFLLKVLAK